MFDDDIEFDDVEGDVVTHKECRRLHREQRRSALSTHMNRYLSDSLTDQESQAPAALQKV